MNIKRIITTIALILGVTILSGCYHTSVDETPMLKSRVTVYCDQDRGLDVFVTNKTGDTMPVQVRFGERDDIHSYETPTRAVRNNTVWSFPGSRPEVVYVVVADVDMTVHRPDYTICSVS